MSSGEKLGGNNSPEQHEAASRETMRERGDTANKAHFESLQREISGMSNADLETMRQQLEAESRGRFEAEKGSAFAVERAAAAGAEAEARSRSETEQPKPAEKEGPAPAPIPAPIPAPKPEATSPKPEAAAPEAPSEETPSAEGEPGEGEALVDPTEAEATRERAKQSEGLKKKLGRIAKVAAPILLAAGLVAGGIIGYNALNKKPEPEDPKPAVTETVEAPEEVNPFVGELENGVKFDYTAYADREILKDSDGDPIIGEDGKIQGTTNKAYWNANDYAVTKDMNFEETSAERAAKAPEFLAGVAHFVLPEDIQEELGIKDMSPTELDDYLSDAKNKDGGELMEKISKAYKEFMESPYTIVDEVSLPDGDYFVSLTYNDAMDLIQTPGVNHFAMAKMHFGPEDPVHAVSVLERVTSDKGADTYRKKLIAYISDECGGTQIIIVEDDVPPDTTIITPDDPDPTPTDEEEEKPGDPEPGPGDDEEEEEEKPTDPKPKPEEGKPTDPDPVPWTPIDPVPVTPAPEETKPKDEDNLIRIDEEIKNEIEEDIGTDKVIIKPTPVVKEEDKTEKPTEEDYDGTEPVIVKNEESEEAEKVEPTKEENDYHEDRGGAHDDEYKPVEENKEGQQAADENEIPVEEAPTGGDELDDILGDLGIN